MSKKPSFCTVKRNFCVFILTHGRADNVITYKTLQRCGYTGKTIFVVDNLDEQVPKYQQNFGAENVVIFDKEKANRTMQTFDNLPKLGVILFARNACFEIAKNLGITHFVELDDDYTDFVYRYVKNDLFKAIPVRDLNTLFDTMCDLLDETHSTTVALAQSGDFIGGKGGMFKERVKRKAMNSFFCRTDNPFQFVGRINEDVNTYTLLGSQGKLFFTTTEASLQQATTQTNKGGMTETYLETGTYWKSFYSVISMPSSVSISTIGGGGNGVAHYRIHHNVNWNNTVPKIIAEEHKK